MRTRDAGFLNGLANHPQIRPHIGAGDGTVDLSAITESTEHVCLRADHGAFVFLKLEPDVYELHTMILPDGRGAGVIPAAHKAFGWMFEAGARELVTYAPEANRAAALMARRAGFEQIGVRPGAWEDGSDIKLFRLTRDRWTALQDKQEALPCP